MTRRLALYIAAGVLLVIGVLSVLSFVADPFGVRSWFRDRAERQAEITRADLQARTVESEGRAAQMDRLETFHREVITIQSATASPVTEARSAPDADIPLDPDRADRLRRADRSLCGVAAGCSAPTDDPR